MTFSAREDFAQQLDTEDPLRSFRDRFHLPLGNNGEPLISHLYEEREIEAIAKNQTECFAAGVLFARAGRDRAGTPATHALAATVEEALRCKESGEEKVILTALCGHGHLDLPAYDAYLSGSIEDHDWDDAVLRDAVATALEKLPAGVG